MALSPWIPTGAHRSMNIERKPSPATGPFNRGTGYGFCIHITVSPWMAVDSMVRVLKDKGAEPNLVIGGRPGYTFPVLVQLLALNQWGKALAHPGGTPDTNRAAGPQIEICARPGNLRAARGEDTGWEGFDLPDLEVPEAVLRDALKYEKGSDGAKALAQVHLCMDETDVLQRAFESGVAAWTDSTYKALANVCLMVDRRSRADVSRQARSFQNVARFSPSEYAKGVRGLHGHMHVPNNDHVDPTSAFRGGHLVRLTKNAPYTL